MVKISSLLIANRGEIAVRIIRTCREMGIRSVAVYSSADATALHVKEADEAFEIGPAPALESYLCIPAILQAARQSRAEAVHPGYGFLAENPEFARETISAALLWVGPPPDALALMGDKVTSKSLAQTLHVPVVPGYDGQDQSVGRFRAEADRIGYPVIIKAKEGGGGRGMREVSRPDDLEVAIESARREAKSSFGEDAVFLEKLLGRPRHIEVQVLADLHGNAVHLGERDCSIQRRHQKVIEEAPSPVFNSDLRAAMCEDALRLVRESLYTGAGTVEFLFADDQYYFLEMNARIQVEHPVTEEITGQDLVRLQIDIAQGHSLPFGQLDVNLNGHAIEARIYAENPETGFLPSTGCLTRFRPPEGIGVRNDVGTSEGSEVSSYYDPMLAKLIVRGANRQEALMRLDGALNHFAISGVSTNISFLKWLVAHERVFSGQADVKFVDRTWKENSTVGVPPEVLMMAAGYEMRAHSYSGPVDTSGAHEQGPWQTTTSWRQIGLPRSFTYLVGAAEHSVEVLRGSGDGLWEFTADRGDPVQLKLTISDGDEVALQFDSQLVSASVERRADGLVVNWNGQPVHLRHRTAGSADHVSNAGVSASGDLSTPMPGTVVKVVVSEGQHVGVRDPLMVLEAMKMEHVISAVHEGVVQKIFFREGDLVPAGSVVLSLEMP